MLDINPQPPSSSNGTVAIDEFPLDLCQEIIRAAVDEYERWPIPLSNVKRLVSLSHISSNFRRASMQCATFWVEALDVRDPCSDRFNTILSRARGVPLTIEGDLRRDIRPTGQSANRTKRLLEESGRAAKISLKFGPKTDLDPLWAALEKPTPLLRELDLYFQDSEPQLGPELHPRKQLFKDDTPARCKLVVRYCSISPTMVATHNLVSLKLLFTSIGQISEEVCQWWSLCTDGNSFPALEYLVITITAIQAEGGSQGHALACANPTPCLPATLKSLGVATTLGTLVALLENVHFPPSCSVRLTAWDSRNTNEWIDGDVQVKQGLIEGIIAILSRVWTSQSQSALCSRLLLHITNPVFHVEYESTDGWIISFAFFWPDFWVRFTGLAVQLLRRLSSDLQFPRFVSSVGLNSWLALYTSCPDVLLTKLLHKPYMDFLRALNSLGGLYIMKQPAIDALNILRSPQPSNPAAGNQFLPGLCRVRLRPRLLENKRRVEDFNNFAAARASLGLPIGVVEVGHRLNGEVCELLQPPLVARPPSPRDEAGWHEGEWVDELDDE